MKLEFISKNHDHDSLPGIVLDHTYRYGDQEISLYLTDNDHIRFSNKPFKWFTLDYFKYEWSFKFQNWFPFNLEEIEEIQKEIDLALQLVKLITIENLKKGEDIDEN